jgi:hypothetical protein
MDQFESSVSAYLRRLIEATSSGSRRSYANWWEGIGPSDRRVKEASIARDFVEALKERGESTFADPVPSPKDPPDCIARYDTSGKAGLEITELVCEQAARATAQGRPVYRNWSRDGVLEQLDRRLVAKDSKVYLGVPYDRLVVVVHTAEFDLPPERTIEWLDGHEFGPFGRIDEAYILFSYKALKGYPIAQLRIKPRSATPAH